jgi:L-alanine-DL-glutamate epimerase-like enolase superfamily enzyme
MKLHIVSETWPIAGDFRIARGTKREAATVLVTVEANGARGRGECVPYARYGETVQSVTDDLRGMAQSLKNGMTREDLQSEMQAGAARNALDCALIDWEAKSTHTPAHVLLGLPEPAPMRSTFTLSLDAPEAMAEAARAAVLRGHTLLKLKIAGEGDLERVRFVREAAPGVQLIADANEGWSFRDLQQLTPELARLGVALLEQPLAEADEAALDDFKSPLPFCADESCHTRADLPRLVSRYSHINIKLDKTGGLTEAVLLAREAQSLGLRLMVGCMVATSLSMAPAALLGPLCDYVDLDGPLLLSRDRVPGLKYEADQVYPATPELWG